MKRLSIDINSDLGESFGVWKMGDDEAVLAFVSSANVACGYHAGDPATMRKTVELCARAGVSVGAHVSYPDLAGFGRRKMSCSPDDVYDCCLYQIGALDAFCRVRGIGLRHVKPHGALYNQAAKERELADSIVRAVSDAGEGIVLIGLASSELEEAARIAGVKFASEAFADRAYLSDGSLMPRSRSGAVIHDAELAAQRAVQIATSGTVTADDGRDIRLKPDTICLHGDTKEAVEMAAAVRHALELAGVKIKPI
jgi:UPF0271 protein